MSSLLVTGGTGSFGTALLEAAIKRRDKWGYRGLDRLVIFSRDEAKQAQLRERFPQDWIRWFIGDVRDPERLALAMQGVDRVVHAAAMKQVPACEYNPTEAVATNVKGTENVVRAALKAGVKWGVLLSTDKACAPNNLYGATKLVAEKIWLGGNVLAGAQMSLFSVLRYGNVLAARGSVLEIWRKCLAEGRPLPVTHPGMTRFWMTVDDAVGLVENALWGPLQWHNEGSVFVPRIKSATMRSLKAVFAPGVETVNLYPRHGEKMDETLITEHEWREGFCAHCSDGVITLRRQCEQCAEAYANGLIGDSWSGGYTSSNPDLLMTDDELRGLLKKAGLIHA